MNHASPEAAVTHTIINVLRLRTINQVAKNRYIVQHTNSTQRHWHLRMQAARKRRWRRPRATCAAAHRARVAELTAARSTRARVGERGTGGGDGGGRGGERRARTDGCALGPAGASCARAPACASRRPAGLAQHPRLRLDGQARRGPHAPANKARRRECSSERWLRTQRKAQRKA